MVAAIGSRGKGRITTVKPNWVVNWQDGSEQWFDNLGDALYALEHNGAASMTLIEAQALIAQARPDAIRPYDMRRNPLTGHFTGGEGR